MIAYGCSITVDATFRARARAGLDRVMATGDRLMAHAAVGSVARTYNLMLDEAAEHEDLEALVLLHQDVELVAPDTPARIRAALASEERVGVIGAIGARGVDSLAWWDGDVVSSSVVYAYGELGGGAIAAPPLHARGEVRAHPHGPVDVLYGIVLVLAPWVVRSLRFDESLGQRHGYDHDLCRQVRAAGGTVLCADLPVVHHHALHLVGDPAAWSRAHRRVAAKWDPDGVDWRRRARAAEADAGGAQLLSASRQLQLEAIVRAHEAERRAVTGTLGWRATRVLRELRSRRATRAELPAG